MEQSPNIRTFSPFYFPSSLPFQSHIFPSSTQTSSLNIISPDISPQFPLSLPPHSHSSTSLRNLFIIPAPHHPSLSFLLSIKSKISNNSLQKQNQTLKDIIHLFIDEEAKALGPNWKIIIMCLSTICLILHHKKSSKKDLIKTLINPRFIGCLLRLDISSILKQNQFVQTSVCHILQLCYQNNLFENSKSPKLIGAYKKFTLGLLKRVSIGQKILFNTLKIVEYLQMRGEMQPADYVRYDVVDVVRDKTMACKIGNVKVYELSYRVIVGANHVEDAFVLYGAMRGRAEEEEGHRRAFLGVLAESMYPVPEEEFEGLVKESLEDNLGRVEGVFWKLLNRQVRGMKQGSFERFVGGRFFEVLAQRWEVVVENEEVFEVVSVVIAIQERAREMKMEMVVNGKIGALLPFLMTHIRESVQQGMEERQ